MQGTEGSWSEHTPHLLLQAHPVNKSAPYPLTTPFPQPPATIPSGEPVDGARCTIGYQPKFSYFRIRYRRWHMRRRLRSAKQDRTKGLITHYFRIRKALVRPIASCPIPPASTVYSSSSSNSNTLLNQECKHLCYEGLRNKALYYNVFEKTHAAGASGYGSVMMGGENASSVDYDFNFDNSGTHPVLEEDLTPLIGGRQANTRQLPDVAGPSRSRGSAGKRKQRDATDEMTFSAIQEIVHYFRGRSQSGGDSEQSVQKDGILHCMNIMKGMGIPPHHRTMMWHYFDSHPHLQGPFCQLDDDDRMSIIYSVVNPQPPPAN